MTAVTWLDAIKRYSLGIWNAGRAARGYLSYRRTGDQSSSALMGLRGIFTADPKLPRCLGRGLGLVASRPSPAVGVTGVLGTPDSRTIDEIIARLDSDGYVVFDAKLSAASIEALNRDLAALPAYAALQLGDTRSAETLDRHRLVASRYDYDPSDLVKSPTIQELIVDRTLSTIADRYLRRDSVLTGLTAWRSFPFGQQPSSAAAQLFHSDRDHLQFLKFFFYLTDVTPTTGPHVFVRASHRERLPVLRRDVRFDDDEVLRLVPSSDLVELCGTAGTMLAVDTSGLHKGKLPVTDERLILQFEFGSSQFGTPGPPLPFAQCSDDALKRIDENRRKFARFRGTTGDGRGGET
jgi:hypothetical protein